MPNAPEQQPLKTAVITGRHAFDVPAFHALFRSMTTVDFYLQELDNFAADAGKSRSHYDVLLFYHMHIETPDEQDRTGKRIKEALMQIGETPQGIVLLHHAILAYPKWPFWSELVGIHERSFGYHTNQTLNIEVTNPTHPITAGFDNWRMGDETYTMANAGDDSNILLTVNHPQSMRTLAWARQYKQARIFCFQCGHDNESFAHSMYRAVLQRGIQWAGGRI